MSLELWVVMLLILLGFISGRWSYSEKLLDEKEAERKSSLPSETSDSLEEFELERFNFLRMGGSRKLGFYSKELVLLRVFLVFLLFFSSERIPSMSYLTASTCYSSSMTSG